MISKEQEVEADYFATHLLVPTTLLKSDLQSKPIEINDDKHLRSLAKRYGVSLQVMARRIHDVLSEG